MKQLDKCWHRTNKAAIGAVISACPIPPATLLLCKAAGANALTHAVCLQVPPHSSSSHTWCHACCIESMYVQSKAHHKMQTSPLCLKLYVYRLLSAALILTGGVRHVTRRINQTKRVKNEFVALEWFKWPFILNRSLDNHSFRCCILSLAKAKITLSD